MKQNAIFLAVLVIATALLGIELIRLQRDTKALAHDLDTAIAAEIDEANAIAQGEETLAEILLIPVEAATCEDIYYLQGRHLYTESGRIDTVFRTYRQACAAFAWLTMEDAKKSCRQ